MASCSCPTRPCLVHDALSSAGTIPMCSHCGTYHDKGAWCLPPSLEVDRERREPVAVMKASDICAKAAELVGGERDRQHGTKRINFENIAALWNAYLEIREGGAWDQNLPLSPADVGHMMVLLKVARTQHGALNMDDYFDMAGYAGCAGEIAAALNGGDGQ